MKLTVAELWKLPGDSFYILLDGRYVGDDRWKNFDASTVVDARLRLRGGKGGFGSQLRSAGSQYQKSQNQDSCRDLSGRRLRDVEEERKLRKWIESAAERERERAERKRAKLERLAGKHEGRHVFQDQDYSTSKRSLLELNADAVDAGIDAALNPDLPSTSGIGRDPLIAVGEGRKRAAPKDPEKGVRGAKCMMWTGIDEAELSSDSETESYSNDDLPGPSCSAEKAEARNPKNPENTGSEGSGSSDEKVDELTKSDLVEKVFGAPQPTLS